MTQSKYDTFPVNLATSSNGDSPAVRPGVTGIRAYTRRAAAPWIDLRLDANEGEAPPANLLGSEADPDSWSRYPSAEILERELAKRLGVDPSRVLVTAGGDEAIDRVCRARLSEGDRVILPTPTFEMIARYARLAGAELIRVPWRTGPFPCARVTAEVSEVTTMVAVVSPNNPTGLTATADDLDRLSAAAPRSLLLVDLAYAEFAEHDLTSAAIALSNAVVIRTFSKAWGLAGLRVGYAIGPASFIAAMRAAGGPFSVPGPSLAVAERMLDRGHGWMTTQVAAIRMQRDQLTAALRSFGVDVAPSEGNFVLATGARARWLCAALASAGIAVREYSDDLVLADAVRISCTARRDEMERVIAAARAALCPTAIIFAVNSTTQTGGDTGTFQTVFRDSRLASLACRVDLGLLTPFVVTGAAAAFSVVQFAPDGMTDAALQRVMSELRATSAWVVTDNPEWCDAARRVGAIPIGLAPQDEAQPLLARGAAAVIDNIAQLEYLLP